MSRDDIQKLLGGYATGTLTPEEQQALFEAALGDQALFDELAREQSLRDLLRDPAARAQLLASLDDRAPVPWLRRRWRPLAATVAMAAMAAAASVTIYVARRGGPGSQPATVADVKVPPALDKAFEPPAPAVPAVPESRRAAHKRPAPTAARPAPVMATAPPPPPPSTQMPKAAEALPAPPLATGGANGVGGIRAAASLGAMQAVIAPPGARSLYYLEAARTGPAADQKSPAGAQPSGRPGRPMMSMARLAGPVEPPAAAHLGVKYSVLRQSADGAFVETDAAQLQAGDTIRLRFEANDSGYLYIWDAAGSQALAAARLERATPFATPPWKAGAAGTREFRVSFARQPGAAANRRGTELSEADPRERVTFVADPSDATAAQQVTFTITLNFR